MKKIQFQERKCVKTPPIAGPAANPTDVAAVSTPNDRPMISLGMNFTQMIGAQAIIIEAPSP